MANEMYAPMPGTPGAADPLVQKLEVESDKRLGRFLAVFSILGGAVIGYGLTVEVVIPVALYATHGEDTARVEMKLADVEKEKKEELKKKNAPPKPRKRAGGGGKPKGKGIPNAPITQA